jgi:SAM-dependent methyltransferase
MRRFFDGLLEHPLVYSVWQAPFVEQKFAPAQRRLESMAIRRVLDVGCGPGTNARRFQHAEYVGIDINERYLAVGRSKYQGQFIHADLEISDLSSLGAFDTIVVNSFLHHLSDTAVHRVQAQVATLLEPQGTVHILELVRPDHLCLGRAMAKLDRGRYARPAVEWQELFTRHFATRVVEPYRYAGGLWHMLYYQGGRLCAFQ